MDMRVRGECTTAGRWLGLRTAVLANKPETTAVDAILATENGKCGLSRASGLRGGVQQITSEHATGDLEAAARPREATRSARQGEHRLVQSSQSAGRIVTG